MTLRRFRCRIAVARTIPVYHPLTCGNTCGDPFMGVSWCTWMHQREYIINGLKAGEKCIRRAINELLTLILPE
jgi:hypothetical protein